MRYSTHDVSIFISEYLGVSCSNLYIFGSTRCCPTRLYRGADYSVKVVPLVINVFNFVSMKLI